MTSKQYVIAVDLGGTNLRAAVISSTGEIGRQLNVPTRADEGPLAVQSQIVHLAKQLQESATEGNIIGIGIGTPGIVDSHNGIVYELTNVKGWKEEHLGEYVKGNTGLQASVDNDVNLTALGELKCGAGQGVRNLVCLTLGTGVGGGIIIGGEIYRGASLSAGEIGHMPVNINGPQCGCGGRACLERYVGNTEIVRRTIEAIKRGEESLLSKLDEVELQAITPADIHRAAVKGDALAIRIWRETGMYIGVALAGVVNFFNPEMIVIGGGVAQAGDYLFQPIRETVKERALRIPAEAVRIKPAQLGGNAGLIGAAMLVFTDTLSSSGLTG